MMNRYARIDLSAVTPRPILGLIEAESAVDGPGLLDITERTDVTESTWYWTPEARVVPAQPSPAHVWNGIEWDLDADQEAAQLATRLADLHQQQQKAIDKECEASISSGFWSSALGAPHQYSSQLDDQLNLTGAILRALEMPYACRDAQGVKAFRLHTAEQLRQVGDDFTLYKLQLLQHANELKQQLDLALEAGDAEAMALIRWEAAQP